MKTEITEYAAGRTARLDASTTTIRGVKVLGLESANGRTYTRHALNKAVPLYEGGCVYIDHADPRKGRTYRDRIGTLTSVHARADGLYADLVYNPKHPHAEQLAWDAEHQTESIGLSHTATVTVTKQNGRTIVESIDDVRSIDLVAEPATVRSLYEQKEIDHSAKDEAFNTDEEAAAKNVNEEEDGEETFHSREICERLDRLEKALQALSNRKAPTQRPQSRDQNEAARPPRTAKDWVHEITH